MPARTAVIAAAAAAVAGPGRDRIELEFTGLQGFSFDGPCGNGQTSHPHTRFVIVTG